MPEPQYILTIALGVGTEGRMRRKLYNEASDGKPVGQWVKEVCDRAAKRKVAQNKKKKQNTK